MSTSSDLLNGRYRRRQLIGVGGFGVVEQYLDTQTGELVAIKTILAKHVNGESLRLLREIDVLRQLSNRHPRVVSVFDVFVSPSGDRPREGAEEFGDETPPPECAEEDYIPPQERSSQRGGLAVQPGTGECITAVSDFDVHIVMPLMRGDLHKYSRDGLPDFPHKREFEQIAAVVFAFQLVFGLDYIHKCGIVHRDLKPENILITLDMSSPYNSAAMIADFGLARDAKSTETFYICTRHYRPPEVITNSASSSLYGIDIWSTGCILFEIVTGRFLFRLPTSLNEAGQWEPARASGQLESILGVVGTPSLDDINQYVDGTRYANIKSYLTKSQPRPCRIPDLIRKYWRLAGISVEEQNLWIDLITSCVRYFPQQRPTAEQLCCHQLFRRYNVFYGQNIKQYEPKPYEPIATATDRRLNKQAILNLVEALGVEARQAHEAAARSTAAGAEGSVAGSTTSAIRAPQTQLPATITDPALRQKYGNVGSTTSDDIQRLMQEVLAELQASLGAKDESKSDQLRHLLSFFVALVPQHTRAGETTEARQAVDG